jgi:CDP-diglyceride synthetase
MNIRSAYYENNSVYHFLFTWFMDHWNVCKQAEKCKKKMNNLFYLFGTIGIIVLVASFHDFLEWMKKRKGSNRGKTN